MLLASDFALSGASSRASESSESVSAAAPRRGADFFKTPDKELFLSTWANDLDALLDKVLMKHCASRSSSRARHCKKVRTPTKAVSTTEKMKKDASARTGMAN